MSIKEVLITLSKICLNNYRVLNCPSKAWCGNDKKELLNIFKASYKIYFGGVERVCRKETMGFNLELVTAKEFNSIFIDNKLIVQNQSLE